MIAGRDDLIPIEYDPEDEREDIPPPGYVAVLCWSFVRGVFTKIEPA